MASLRVGLRACLARCISQTLSTYLGMQLISRSIIRSYPPIWVSSVNTTDQVPRNHRAMQGWLWQPSRPWQSGINYVYEHVLFRPSVVGIKSCLLSILGKWKYNIPSANCTLDLKRAKSVSVGTAWQLVATSKNHRPEIRCRVFRCPVQKRPDHWRTIPGFNRRTRPSGPAHDDCDCSARYGSSWLWHTNLLHPFCSRSQLSYFFATSLLLWTCDGLLEILSGNAWGVGRKLGREQLFRHLNEPRLLCSKLTKMHHLNYRPIFAKWTSTALLECHVPPQLSVSSIFFGLPDGVDFQMGLVARWGYMPAFPTA